MTCARSTSDAGSNGWFLSDHVTNQEKEEEEEEEEEEEQQQEEQQQRQQQHQRGKKSPSRSAFITTTAVSTTNTKRSPNSMHSLSEDGEPLALVAPPVGPEPLHVRAPRERVFLREEVASVLLSLHPLRGVVQSGGDVLALVYPGLEHVLDR